MKLAAALVCAALLSTGCSATVVRRLARIPIAPPGARVTRDAALGFERYAEALAADGAWEPDPRFGALWCPADRAFVPYASRGHWTVSRRPIGKAPAGVTAWASDAGLAWADVTTHHGAWIPVEEDDEPKRWCWVPGAEETPARVVWRTGGGFVGWAPDSPDLADGDDVDFDALDWVFTLLGDLYDDSIGDDLLGGDARGAADEATSRGGARRARTARTAPTARDVKRARRELRDYVAAHARAARAVASVDAGQGSASGDAKGRGEGASKGDKKASSSKSKKSDGDEDTQRDPPPMALYRMMVLDPGAPIDVGPRYQRVALDTRSGGGGAWRAGFGFEHEPGRGDAGLGDARSALRGDAREPMHARSSSHSSGSHHASHHAGSKHHSSSKHH